MMRISSFMLLFLMGWTVFGQRTMHVEGNKIYTACEEEVVMRGVNEMFVWSQDKTGATTLPEIAETGANTVRLVWTTEGSVSDLDALIANCLEHNMIPVPELHDATGDFAELPKLLDYWTRPEVLEVIQKYKQWIIVNIGNEVGAGSETNAQWRTYYEDAVTRLRDAGIDVPLMIDCGNYGSDEEYFLSEGNSLLEHDPMSNLIFSVHTYWVDPDSTQGRKNRLDDLISEASEKELPFIIGEGPQWAASPWQDYCEVEFPYAYLLQRCEEEGIGWLSWSWGLVDNDDCGAPNSVFDITTDGEYGNWSDDFGEEIMVTDPNSVQNTSVIPESMLTGNCGEACTAPVLTAVDGNNSCVSGEVEISLSNDEVLTDDHTIRWFKDNELIDNASGSSYTASSTGYYRIELDSADECQTFDDLYVEGEIDVDPGEDIVLCDTREEELSVNPSSTAYEISWYAGEQELTIYQNEEQILVDSAATYAVKVFSDYCEGTDTVEVTSLLPQARDTTVSPGEQTLYVPGNGNYVWYDSEALDDPLHTGNEYTVDIASDKTYYIRDESGFEGRLGKEELGSSYWDTWDNESKQYKLGFEVFETLTVQYFDVYAQSAGSVNVVFYNESLDPIDTLQRTVSSGKNTLTIEKSFDPGVYYADVAGSEVNLRLNHDEGDYTTEYPYTLDNGNSTLITIDRTEPEWIKNSPWYLFFYNWKVTRESGASCVAVPMVVNVDWSVDVTESKPHEKRLEAYPNPTTGQLHLTESVSWELYSIEGTHIKSGEGQEVEMKSLTKGMYILRTDKRFVKVEKH